MDGRYVNIHTHRRTGVGVEVVSVGAGLKPPLGVGTGDFPAPPFSIGIHPYSVNHIGTERALAQVETAPAWAIGEIGLDRAMEGADHEAQEEVFAAQLRIAGARGLPVILHCVRAFEPTMEILATHRPSAVIFHGFIGSPEQAARAVSAGYCLSFGERSMNSPKTVEVLRGVPLDRLFLETDDSPAPIAEIYSRAAALLSVSVGELAVRLYDNYMRVFQFVICN